MREIEDTEPLQAYQETVREQFDPLVRLARERAHRLTAAMFAAQVRWQEHVARQRLRQPAD